MSNIEKIKAEIERIINEETPVSKGVDYYHGVKESMEILLSFIDSLPEDDPLNDQRFGEGFDAGRVVQRIFDETEEKPSEDLKEAAEKYADEEMMSGLAERAFIAGAKWMESQMPLPEDTVIFMKGVAEGRRLEREDREENKRKEDELPRFYGD